MTVAEFGEEHTDALVAEGVAKAFAGAFALADFDMTIGKGEIHALIGENGSGKSTFIKILSGFHAPEHGSRVLVGGQYLEFGSAQSSSALGCRFVHQDLGLIGVSSVMDNILLTQGFPQRFGNLRLRAARRNAAVALERVGLSVDPRQPLEALAPAEKTGVAVARALYDGEGARSARLLVLDEPTATLPDADIERLLGIVRSVADSGMGVLYVSHRLEEVLTLADRVTVLRDGRKVATRPSRELDRARMVTLLVGHEIDDVRAMAAELPAVAEVAPALEVEGLVAPSIAGVSLACPPGEILGVAGITGSGRDALLGAIFGVLRRFSGTVRIDDHEVPIGRPDRAIDLGLAYLPPDRRQQSGIMSMNVPENLTLANLAPVWGRLGWRRGAALREVRSWFSRLRVNPPGAYRADLQTFSGGNQQKILLAKWLRLRPRVLLLDEPTQGVDIGARAVLHAELIDAARAGTIIVCSSTDVDELAALCRRVLIMSKGKIATILEGSEVTTGNITRACHMAEAA